MKLYLSAIALLINLVSINAYCAINKWVDDSGRIHYSDQTPLDDTKTTLLGRISAASGVAASEVSEPKSLAEREADFKKSNKAKAEIQQKSAQKQEEANAKQKYCLDVRSSLKSLEESPRLSTYDANGELSYLDDAARQQRIQEARTAMATNCK